ncbi:hypothetical protein NL676_015654 [Syzygium grande]|nr:hypothetical protein NL676_015654 [Syzygium grande]
MRWWRRLRRGILWLRQWTPGLLIHEEEEEDISVIARPYWVHFVSSREADERSSPLASPVSCHVGGFHLRKCPLARAMESLDTYDPPTTCKSPKPDDDELEPYGFFVHLKKTHAIFGFTARERNEFD